MEERKISCARIFGSKPKVQFTPCFRPNCCSLLLHCVLADTFHSSRPPRGLTTLKRLEKSTLFFLIFSFLVFLERSVCPPLLVTSVLTSTWYRTWFSLGKLKFMYVVLNDPVRTSQRTQHATKRKDSRWLLHGETKMVCCESHSDTHTHTHTHTHTLTHTLTHTHTHSHTLTYTQTHTHHTHTQTHTHTYTHTHTHHTHPTHTDRQY